MYKASWISVKENRLWVQARLLFLFLLLPSYWCRMSCNNTLCTLVHVPTLVLYHIKCGMMQENVDGWKIKRLVKNVVQPTLWRLCVSTFALSEGWDWCVMTELRIVCMSEASCTCPYLCVAIIAQSIIATQRYGLARETSVSVCVHVCVVIYSHPCLCNAGGCWIEPVYSNTMQLAHKCMINVNNKNAYLSSVEMQSCSMVLVFLLTS